MVSSDNEFINLGELSDIRDFNEINTLNTLNKLSDFKQFKQLKNIILIQTTIILINMILLFFILTIIVIIYTGISKNLNNLSKVEYFIDKIDYEKIIDLYTQSQNMNISQDIIINDLLYTLQSVDELSKNQNLAQNINYLLDIACKFFKCPN
jgi:hypothetical protein